MYLTYMIDSLRVAGFKSRHVDRGWVHCKPYLYQYKEGVGSDGFKG